MTLDAVGGVWQYSLGLAEQLTRVGDAVVLAGLGPGPSPLMRADAERVAPLTWLSTPPDWLARGPDDLAPLSLELAELVRTHAIDLVHLNAPAQAASLSLACPVVVVSHSCVPTWFRAVHGSPPSGDWGWHLDCNRRGLKAADLVIALSASHASALADCYGPVPNLRVVHNAVVAGTRPAPRRDTVFAVGRWWDEGKNGSCLDDAAAGSAWPVLAAGPTAGPNGQTAHLRHACGLGPIPNSETRALMSTCGIFVSPSLYEPFGLAALEAAIAATPLLLADIPTYRELWDGAALFFPPRDPAALRGAIAELAASPRMRSRLGAAARQRAERFSPGRQLASMRMAYAEAASAHIQRH